MINASKFRKTRFPGLKWMKEKKRALFDIRDAKGKRWRQVAVFASLEDAESAFLARREELRAGTPKVERAPDSVHQRTLAAYFDDQFESLHAKCSDSTKATNRSTFNNNIREYIGNRSVSDIDEATCEDLVGALRRENKSPSTINLALRVLRKTLHHARRRKQRGDVPENFHMVPERRLMLEMSDDEQRRFLAAFDDRIAFGEYLATSQKRTGKVVLSEHFGRNVRSFGGGRRADSQAADIYFDRFHTARPIFVGALDLGLRITDLRLLKRESVDLKRRIVNVQCEKTGKPATIALSDRCFSAIKQAISEAPALSEYVFTTVNGKPYSESTLRDYFALAKRFAGITRRCRFGDLRHTFASNLVSNGVSIVVVRDALGHTTTRMTERYAKPNSNALEIMRAALNDQANRSMDTLWTPDAQDAGQ